MENSDEEKLSQLRKLHYETYNNIYIKYNPFLETHVDDNLFYLFAEIPFFLFVS